MNKLEYEKELRARATPVLETIRALKGDDYIDILSTQGALISVANMLLSSKSMKEVQYAVEMLGHAQTTLLIIQCEALAKLRGKGTGQEIADEVLDDYATLGKQFNIAIQNANSC